MHHTHGVAGSSPVVSTFTAYYRIWGHSSAGRALRSQRKGRGFESRCLHESKSLETSRFSFKTKGFRAFLMLKKSLINYIKNHSIGVFATRNATRKKAGFSREILPFSPTPQSKSPWLRSPGCASTRPQADRLRCCQGNTSPPSRPPDRIPFRPTCASRCTDIRPG